MFRLHGFKTALLLIVIPAALSAAPVRVRLEGLKRTKPSFVMQLCGLEPETDSSRLSPELFSRIRQQLYRTGLFSAVSVDLQPAVKGQDSVLVVRVKEKYSLIPIPFAVSSGNRTSGGVFLLDANFLGRGGRLFAGLTASKDGFNGMAGVMTDRLFGSRLTGSFFASYMDTLFENRAAEGTMLTAGEITRAMAQGSLGYRWSESFKTALKAGVLTVGSGDSGLEARLFGVLFVYGIELQWERLHWRPFFQEGFHLRAQLDRSVNGEAAWTGAGAQLRWSTLLGSVHRVSVLLHGMTGDVPELYSRAAGGRPGFRSFPAQEFRVEDALAADLSYELPLFHTGAVMGAVLAFVEGGVFRGYDRTESGFSGVGAGFNLYLKRLALPAVGVFGAYNLTFQEFQWSVSLGMNFF